VPDDLEDLDAGDAEPSYSIRWLTSRAYEFLPMGIPERNAMTWYDYDPLLYVVAGVGATLATFVTVDRRRPNT
jgi:hypothetical protein